MSGTSRTEQGKTVAREVPMAPSLTYHTYCAWFSRTYGRPFAASETEFLAALAAQPPTIPANASLDDPTYLDGIEDREGLYR